MIVRLLRIAGCARIGALAVALGLGACGSSGPELGGAEFKAPATAVSYVSMIEGMPDDEMTALAQDSLSIFRQRGSGAYSIALLRRRGENDLAVVQQILRSRGYYNGTAEVTVEEISQERFDDLDPFELNLPTLQDLMFWRSQPGDDEEEREPQSFALVVITVDPGTQFTLASHEFKFQDPEMRAVVPSPATLGSPVGGPALAVPIVGAEASAVDFLKGLGYPYAASMGRDAVADLALATLEVQSQLRSGPSATFGPVTFDGLDDVREQYLRTYLPWKEGDVVDQASLRTFQESLLATDLFDTLIVQIPPDPPEGEGPVSLPVTVTVDERPFRTIGLGGGFSTDEGPFVTAQLEHRNLWGENETLTLEADIGTEQQGILIGYLEPQYLIPGQDLLAALEVVHDNNDAYEEQRATLTGGFRRRLTPDWIVGYGGLAEASRIDQGGVEKDALIAGIPTWAEYDDTDDLLNPTRGVRARFDVTPFAGTLAEEFTSFLTLDNRASTYWDVLDDGIYVLAGRARLATDIADSLDDIPGNRRLYAGGGGSVRGYAQYTVGPFDSLNEPTGGRSAVEASVEMRARVWGDLGVVTFVDAGSVSQAMYPNFEAGVQVGVGVGVRYYSPAGPIRLDLAFPLERRRIDDAFQLYFSIGQAF